MASMRQTTWHTVEHFQTADVRTAQTRPWHAENFRLIIRRENVSLASIRNFRDPNSIPNKVLHWLVHWYKYSNELRVSLIDLRTLWPVKSYEAAMDIYGRAQIKANPYERLSSSPY